MALEEKEGSIIIAEEQISGSGRRGRSWISPKGKGIYMTIILKPNLNPMKISKISLVAAASVYKALKKMKIDSKIKWPNDIIMGNKKIGGILTEMDTSENNINYVVVGIGININLEEKHIPKELAHKATSIKIEEKKEINKNLLMGHILNEFEKYYIPFKVSGEAKKPIEICRENSALINKEIRIIRGKKIKYGKALDINKEGELVVEFENGKIENIISGEISIRGKEGYL